MRAVNPTGRFSNRVDFYVKHRPGYPPAALDVLHDVLKPGCAVADIGSGTGISSRWLLQRAPLVYGVEPNLEMRSHAVECAGFVSIDGTAEATGLDDASVDAIVCATAFHWFRPSDARREFKRILRPGGAVVLLWNVRKRDASALQQGYEQLILDFAVDYKPAWDHESATIVDEFFNGYRSAAVPNQQLLDWQGLYGRAMSASYIPLPGEAGHDAFVAKLRELFEAEQVDGFVRFEYETMLYWGGASSLNK
jgi:SAM-dependent methyltransferase